jgi:hypothetical protein
MIEAIRTFMLTCPHLNDMEKMGIDYLPGDPINCSIDEVPVEPIIQSFIDGSSERQLVFNFDSRLYYSAETINNIENSSLYENISDWLEEQSKAGNLPILPSGKIATKIEALSNGYLYDTPESMDNARYRLQCRLIYEKEA